ncbi:dehydrogenase [Agrilactobacillus composti DSM 18527 = JCM 14202]|uniref:Dehydrogenase n=1 Tax=Agrilactobacillus composti DSM 18527 = JCM 14202 TaxID=1423734 RepID=X0PIH4_9LACO|nr:zinc-binding dehydrogenase [Agrilactobacillus composti]KRM32911.1 dehydrogenase [Agrilactobacillus composti DSM 18527 = JCM 14202]GAF41903.1 bifunctional protein: zinc-containing alcohol dehydrogenase [Agrilactobacillus composti DSM 18527 = JCM 14202]
MKAIVIDDPGGPEQLKLKDVPTPTVKPGWSLVQIKGFGINRSEIFTRLGYSPVTFPRILGIEGVGVIAQTTDASRLPVGQKVVSLMHGMGRAFDGSYAEYALLPNASIYPVNTQLSWPELAAVPETYYTAYGSLLNLKIQQAKTLLVRGGTSGVGVAAMQLAQALVPGLQVTGSTRQPEKFAIMQRAGFQDTVLDDHRHLQTTAKFDAILELVGPDTLMDSLTHLQVGGYACFTGELSGMDDARWTIADFDPFGIPAGAYLTHFSSEAANAQAINDLLQLIETHHINVQPVQVFDLAHTAAAQGALDQKTSFGKVVVINS